MRTGLAIFREDGRGRSLIDYPLFMGYSTRLIILSLLGNCVKHAPVSGVSVGEQPTSDVLWGPVVGLVEEQGDENTTKIYEYFILCMLNPKSSLY